MINLVGVLIIFFCIFQPTFSDVGDPYGLINAVQTECEYQALTIGTRLSDAFNSGDEDVPFYRRFQNDYLQRISSFHRIIMIEMERRHLPHFLRDNSLQVRHSLEFLSALIYLDIVLLVER